MPKVFSIEKLPFETREARVPEFVWHTSPRLAKLANSRYLQIDVRSIDPDRFSFPYHFHRAAEEFFLILSGEATLRSPDGFQKVSKGDLIFFEEGPAGAHQLYNHRDAPCVYLDVRATFGLDVAEYPDSGKLNILPFQEVFETASKADYYKGEEDVAGKWPKDLLRRTSTKSNKTN
jgi:uncharacterized cupin superfamily protein